MIPHSYVEEFRVMCKEKKTILTYMMVQFLSPGPGCSKLTTSLVNVSSKFHKSKTEICQYLLLKKCEKLLQCKSFSHFFNKNISVFGY